MKNNKIATKDTDWEAPMSWFATTKFDSFPRWELVETKDAFIATFDLPGVKKEDIATELNGNILTVTATRSSEKKDSTAKSHHSEIRYGAYSRSFTIPSAIVENKVSAKFEQGVLTVTMAKKEPTNTKTIEIH